MQSTLDVRKIYVEITGRCNLDCIFCVRRSWLEGPGEMSLEGFREIITQLRAFPRLETVNFGGFGEPLSHPEIVKMLRLAKDLGVKTELTTNATLLEEPMARELVASGLDTIVVSVDSVTPPTYQQIRVGTDLPKVLNNLNALHLVRDGNHGRTPKLGLEFVAMRRNYEEFPALLKTAVSLNASFILVTNLMPHTEEMSREILYDDGLQPALSPLRFAVRTILPQNRLRTERRCRFIGRDSLTIAWDGQVSPCYPLMHTHSCYVYGRHKTMERYSLGSVWQEGLVSIWASEEYTRFRAKVKCFDFPSCTDCQFVEWCNMASTNTIDCWGNTPSCADCLWARGIIECL
jgi:tungsten cofactor oxidoreducase radical SAM maturase